MQSLRTVVKSLPGAVQTVRKLRQMKRNRRAAHLLSSHPNGDYLNCHGVPVFCDFRIPTFHWYDGFHENLSWDLKVVDFLASHGQGDLFLDIGAHFGFFSAYLSRVIKQRFPTGKLIAVEPDVDNFRCLQQTLSHQQNEGLTVDALPVALSAEDSRLTLYRNDADCLNSYPDVGAQGCYEVDALRFDTIIERHADGRRVNFIKIDIDGPEPLLFDGGKSVLKRDEPNILMEFCPTHLKAFGREPKQFFSQLCDDFNVYWLNYLANEVRQVDRSNFVEIEETVGERITDFVLSSAELPIGQLAFNTNATKRAA